MHQATLSKSLSSSCFLFSCPCVWGERRVALWRAWRIAEVLVSPGHSLLPPEVEALLLLPVCLSVSSSCLLLLSVQFHMKRHLFCFPGAERLDKCSVPSLKAVFSETLRCLIRWSGVSNGNFQLFALTAQESDLKSGAW